MTKAHADDFVVFFETLRDTICLFDELLVFENEKLDAVAANDVDRLDRRLNEEQACLLRMKNLDAKREQLQQKLGYADMTLKQIAEQIGGAEQAALLALYDELSAKSTELKDAIATTKKFIDLHINAIGILLENLETGGATYTSDGEKAAETATPQRFESKKV